MAGRRGKSSEVTGIELGHEVEGLSCGYGVIDMVSGVPHVLFPRATIVELFGLKSSSKTTLILATIAFNQMINPNFKVYYADFEKMLRKQSDYIQSLGVDIESENFTVGDFSTMEEGCDAILDIIRNDNYDLIVVDTVAAMRPAAELEKGFAQSKQIGLKGKLMSEFLRNIMADIPEDGPAVVFINQMYKDIQNSSFVQLYNTPSSAALAFYAGIRIEVRESTKLKDKRINPYTFEEVDVPVGSTINIRTLKNKVGTPYLSSNYVITFGRGIDISYSIIAAAIKSGIITNKGNSKSSFLYPKSDGTEGSANGMSKLNEKLISNLDDLVHIASSINDLWKYDAQFIKQIEERKTCMAQTPFDYYETGDGESLSLDGSGEMPEEPEDVEDSSESEEEESSDGVGEKTLESAFGGKKPLQLHIKSGK